LKQEPQSIIFFHKFLMDMFKMEREIDCLEMEGCNNTDIQEQKPLSEEGNILDLHITEIKTECKDHSYDLKTEMTFDETLVAIDFPIVKYEAKEENVLDLNMTEIKKECMDKNSDLMSAIPEETPVPDFPIVKSEAEEEARELNKVEQDVKLEVTAKDDEIFIESFGVPSSCDIITDDGWMEIDEKAFKSDICGKWFFDSTGPKNHVLLHKHMRPFICDVCGVDCLHLERLERHRLTHTGEKKFSCDLCGKEFIKSNDLKNHARVHTGEKPFDCAICGKKFALSGNLKKHTLVHTGEKAFSCDTCGKKFFKPSDLKNHERVHTGEKPFDCDICEKKFSLSSNLKKYTLVHTAEKTFSCDTCGKKFFKSSDLKKHERVHTGEKPFTCHICRKKFSKSCILKKHSLIHTGEKPFSCLVCGKKFTQSGNLKTHALVHSGEKAFDCDICGKKFSQFRHLKNHERRHTGEKAFSCVICGKEFSESGSLKKHALVHTGEKAFSCDICGKNFSQSSNLEKHSRVHTGEKPFDCDICGKKFSQSNHLKSHELRHTGQKAFSCDICGKKFWESEQNCQFLVQVRSPWLVLLAHKSLLYVEPQAFQVHCNTDRGSLMIYILPDITSVTRGIHDIRSDLQHVVQGAKVVKLFQVVPMQRMDFLNIQTVVDIVICTKALNISKAMKESGEYCQRFVMDVIKKEPEVDPLAIQWSDNTDTDEKKPLSEEENALDLNMTEIKKECMDKNSDLMSAVKAKETPVTDFPIVKSEAEEEARELNKVEQDVKLEVTAEEDEIFIERSAGFLNMCSHNVVSTGCNKSPLCILCYFKINDVIDNPADCEVRSVIRFLNARHLKPAEIYRQLKEVYGDTVMNERNVRKWCEMFNNGRTNVHDETRPGRPSLITEDLKTKVNNRILQDRRTSLDELHIAFPDISRSLLGETVLQHLGYHKICARWVPRQLSDQHKTQRMASALTFLMRYHTDGDAFLDQIVTVMRPGCLTTPQRPSANHARVVLLHENARPHTAASTRELLDQFGWEIFDHPPYSPDLSPSDFHLFTKLTDFLGGTRFGSDEELKKTVNTWLNDLAAEECKTGILKLVNRYDKCLNVGGDYVENYGVPSSCDSITEDGWMETHEKALKSDVCGKWFFDSTRLKNHVLLHKHMRPFVCDVCGEDCLHLDRLKRHRRVHTGKKAFSCDTCGKKFFKPSDLKYHERVHTGEKPFDCDICRKKFSSSGEKPFDCAICGKKFSSSRNLKKHTVAHTAEKPFGCDECGKKFFKSSVLKNHERVHTGEKPFTCHICGKKCSKSYILKKHSLIHTGEKPFSCLVCGKKFTQSFKLKSHALVHSGEKAFNCDICGKKFCESSSLKRHTIVHTGEKPFSCDICGKKYSQSGGLKQHARIHTGERPFDCDICGMKFSQSAHQKSHKRRHLGEKAFSCDICGKKFCEPSGLKRHAIVHTGEKAFSCDICGKKYSQSGKLKKHALKHTNENARIYRTEGIQL
ncbi:hypothetical protein ANN_27747, partial [Periplaneta americana]